MADGGLGPGSGAGGAPGSPNRRPRLRAPGAGRPRKSARLHALHGTSSRAPTRGRNSAVAPPAAARPAVRDPRVLEPDPKLNLSADAADFWRKFAPELAAAGRLRFAHLPTWIMLVETWGLYRAAVRATPKRISAKVFPPAIAIRRQALEKLVHLCGRFGLDPATDARLLMGGEDPLGAGAPPPVSSPAAGSDRNDDWMRTYGRTPGA